MSETQTADGVESVVRCRQRWPDVHDCSVAERARALVNELEGLHSGREIVLVAHGDTLGVGVL